MGAPKTNTLSQRDLEVAGKVWQCFKTEPQIDFAKLATIAGFKNPASASACWNPIKKKLMAASGTATPTTPGTPVSGRSSAKRKAPASASLYDDVGGNDDDELPGSPTPKMKKGGGSKKTKKAVISSLDEWDGDEANDIKVKVEKGFFGGGESGDDGDAAIAAAELSYFASAADEEA